MSRESNVEVVREAVDAFRRLGRACLDPREAMAAAGLGDGERPDVG